MEHRITIESGLTFEFTQGKRYAIVTAVKIGLLATGPYVYPHNGGMIVYYEYVDVASAEGSLSLAAFVKAINDGLIKIVEQEG